MSENSCTDLVGARTFGSSRVRPLHVLKFGGTSVGTVESLRRVVAIVERAAAGQQVVVVASAAAGVTDHLVQAAETVGGSQEARAWGERLARHHRALAQGLLEGPARLRYRVFVRVHRAALERVLEKIAKERCTPALRDEVLATGERLMAPLVVFALEQAGLAATAVDAAALICTDAAHGGAAVDLEETARCVRRWHRALPARTIPVVPGFIGSTAGGAVTTLGRGGSDYTAALLAGALQADLLERWTDVDGLYTRDPRRHAGAERLDYLVLEQAAAWNRAGRLGMYRKALDPLVAARVPVHVRATHAPDRPGTLILPAGHELLSEHALVCERKHD